MFKVNEYFGGKVVSIGFQTETLPATVGGMAPGEHEFLNPERASKCHQTGLSNYRSPWILPTCVSTNKVTGQQRIAISARAHLQIRD